MYVKLNMYDALTYVMGRTYLSSPTRARARTLRLIAQPLYFVCFLSLPRTARQQFLRALMWSLLIVSTSRARVSA